MKKRRTIDPMIAMINVVFLLLAFFMLGQFAPSRPVGLTLPVAKTADDVEEKHVLFVSEAGEMSYQGLDGEAALDALEGGVLISADAHLSANRLIEIMHEIRQSGVKISGLESVQ